MRKKNLILNIFWKIKFQWKYATHCWNFLSFSYGFAMLKSFIKIVSIWAVHCINIYIKFKDHKPFFQKTKNKKSPWSYALWNILIWKMLTKLLKFLITKHFFLTFLAMASPWPKKKSYWKVDRHGLAYSILAKVKFKENSEYICMMKQKIKYALWKSFLTFRKQI